jgi:hypothetical protein
MEEDTGQQQLSIKKIVLAVQNARKFALIL